MRSSGRTMDWLIWSTMVLAGFIIGTMAMEIIMEMCKIISNVIKFRIEMFQLVLVKQPKSFLFL